MEDFIINAQTVSAGESKQIVLNSYELHTKTKIEIPVFVFRSKKKRSYSIAICWHARRGNQWH
jgi:hypothetical protein